jgi:glucose-6-phosphate 1-epimerase
MSAARETGFRGQPAVALQSPDGARAVVLLHGGQVVSWVPAGGEEQLYLSETSRYGEGQSVRGGVPVIFPQFAARGPLPRHGLLRTRAWTLAEALVRGRHAQAVLRFVSDAGTRAHWPHEFEAEITVSVGGRQIDIELAIVNTGSTPFEFTAALHTYLRTADVQKLQLEGLQGVRYEDSLTGELQQQWGDVTTVVTEVDRIYQDATRTLTVRELGRRLAIDASGFPDVVVWNPGAEKTAQLKDMPADDWRKMLCVEAACVHEPALLQPGEEWSGMQTLVAS